MKPLALLRKEALTVRRNLGLFIVVLIIVPAGLAVGTAVYQQTIPQDIPVAVTPSGEDTTDDDLQLVRGAVLFFATPESYDDRAAARQAVEREEVYLAFVVPPGLTDQDASVTVTVLSDRTNAPLREPAELALGLLETRFDQLAPADVSFEIEEFGTEQTLSGYLLPSALFGLIVLYALVYLPYQVREERRVMDRLRMETGLEAVVASKLLFYGGLVAVPAATISLAARYFDYGFTALGIGSLVVLLLTFLYLAAIGIAIIFLFRLRQVAVFVNLGLAIGVLTLSGLIYPVGFYSDVRLLIARSLPTHYSLVALRGTMLRNASLSLYTDYLGWLLAAVVGGCMVLLLAIRYYERGGVYE